MSLAEFHSLFPKTCYFLEQAKINARVGQAYLLVGDQPELLHRFAMAWAQTAACTHGNQTGIACMKCRSCQLIQNNSYTELYTLAPLSKSRIITIDAMREFENMLSLVSSAGRLKIGLISEAECLGAEAQNAFLKTLEEPPPRTMLLLTTTRPRQLLPTIRSRCQTLLLLQNKQEYPLAQQYGLFEILARIKRQAGIKVAMQSHADIQKILSSLRQEAENSVEENWDRRWEDSADGNKALQKKLDELRTVKIESEYVRMREELLDAMLTWFQQRLLRAAGVKDELLPHPEFLALDKKSKTGEEALQTCEQDLLWMEELLRALKANVDESLALEVLLLSICEKNPQAPRKR